MKKPRTPYKGPKRRKLSWPPQQHPSKDGAPVYDGEPMISPLLRWANDKSLRTERVVDCCDCGLSHLFTFEVFEQSGQFYLVRRAYRLSVDTAATRIRKKRGKR